MTVRKGIWSIKLNPSTLTTFLLKVMTKNQNGINRSTTATLKVVIIHLREAIKLLLERVTRLPREKATRVLDRGAKKVNRDQTRSSEKLSCQVL